VIGKQPMLWDLVWGTRRALPEYRVEKDVTVVPVRFAARQSWFLVFNPSTAAAPKPATSRNFPATRLALDLGGAWEVRFDPKWGGPASVMFDRPVAQSFNWRQQTSRGQTVHEIELQAEVRRSAGALWAAWASHVTG
jgi:hypothetical protein